MSWIVAVAGMTVLAFGAAAQDTGSPVAFRDCADVCPPMVEISAGEFLMGEAHPAFLQPRAPDPRRMTIDWPFALSRHEITFAQFDACVEAGGCPRRPDSEGLDRARHPVFNVSWDDAQTYVRWLSAHTGQHYRLPTGVEWEYAARAGAATPWSTGETLGPDQAHYWYDVEDRREAPSVPAPVGSYPPNAFGLHDMHGNLAEWVEDCMNGFFVLTDSGPLGPGDECYWRGLRGGDWQDPIENLRVARLWGVEPAVGDSLWGFRVLRSLETPPPHQRSDLDAAQGGDAEAAHRAARRFLNGLDGVGQDRAEALIWYHRAALSHHGPSAYVIGLYHQEGWGGARRDLREALKWFRFAAALNEPWAMWQIGRYYDPRATPVTDEVLTLEFEPPLAWYRRAAEAGHAESMWWIALAYEWGELDLEPDLQLALDWARRAVEAGHPDASDTVARIETALSMRP